MRRSRKTFMTCLTVWLVVDPLALAAYAQSAADAAVTAARNWRMQKEHEILFEHVEFVSIRNVSRDTPNVRRNAEHLLGMLAKRGLLAKLLEVPDAPPLVYGELMQTGASSTYVFYGHYDGQPVDPKEWATPPFEPTLRDQRLDKGGKILSLPAPGQSLNSEWRLYARAAADDKAPIMAMMAALDALRSAGIQPKANLKFVFDGEEEIGSPNLARLLTAHRDLLQADLWIICDGPERLSRRQTVVVGHSVGGIILVKVLTEHPWAREFGAIFLLAAPFAGDGGWSSDNLQFPPDLGARFPKGVPIHFYHGLEDEVVPPSHVDLYARAVPQARVHRLRGRDHQLNNDLREVARAIVSLEAGR